MTQHKTQHGPPQADLGTDGCAKPAAPCPLAITEKHAALHTLLAILHQPKEGGGSTLYCKGGGGVLAKPRWMNGTPGQKGVGTGRSMHKEALGDFNQALATRGRTGGLGSGLHREDMAPGKLKDWGFGNAGTLILG